MPGGAEAALPALGVAERLDRDDLDRGDRRDHELRDAVAPLDQERLGAEIDQQHHDLAAIVGIDGARAVQQRHAMLQGEPERGRTCAS